MTERLPLVKRPPPRPSRNSLSHPHSHQPQAQQSNAPVSKSLFFMMSAVLARFIQAFFANSLYWMVDNFKDSTELTSYIIISSGLVFGMSFIISIFISELLAELCSRDVLEGGCYYSSAPQGKRLGRSISYAILSLTALSFQLLSIFFLVFINFGAIVVALTYFSGPTYVLCYARWARRHKAIGLAVCNIIVLLSIGLFVLAFMGSYEAMMVDYVTLPSVGLIDLGVLFVVFNSVESFYSMLSFYNRDGVFRKESIISLVFLGFFFPAVSFSDFTFMPLAGPYQTRGKRGGATYEKHPYGARGLGKAKIALQNWWNTVASVFSFMSDEME
eukprot:gnl/Dysnectes_brevis/1699_a1932_2195.p1 GENE.gnl/Dysnectes_brevis/1699_a1932_2195~~gnl/Dysnectes_brevis/1699_a1932_2195.p1  ORF type:complete len:330 (+),score=47.34 gnl/Dysnectes_brevis/1699_a1932_2195:137-1126(+)